MLGNVCRVRCKSLHLDLLAGDHIENSWMMIFTFPFSRHCLINSSCRYLLQN